MRLLKILLTVLVALILLLVLVFAFFNGFSKLNFVIVQRGGEILVYEEVIGDYGQTPEVTNRVYEALLNDYKIGTTRGFGIFYDNPKEVKKEQLRSESGCIIEGTLTAAQIAEIQKRFKVKTLPQGSYLKTTFPYKGSLSIMVGLIKVYPALEKYAQNHGFDKPSPIMEIYDVPNKTIEYLKFLNVHE